MSKSAMDNGNMAIEFDRVTIRPHLGTGWETVFNEVNQEITMQLKILGLRLPLRRRVPYSQVARILTNCRESWWSRAGIGGGKDLIGFGGSPTHAEMPSKGWRYDILIVVKGGKSIRIGTVKSPDIANEIEWECKRRLKLSET